MGDEFWRRAWVRRVIDGDTVALTIDLGFNVAIWEHVRLDGIDTPEVRTRDLVEKAAGLKAKRFVELWCEGYGGLVWLHSVKFATGKYGRILGRIYDVSGSDCLNDALLSEGLVVPYR